jgi:hypothetical protein
MLQKARDFEKKYLPYTVEELPKFHVTGGIGWINDPNGFAPYKGEYHLFFQYYPYDTKEISNLLADIDKCIETARANAIMNGFSDADWDKLQSDLQAYKLDQLLGIFQKYVDAASDAALIAK